MGNRYLVVSDLHLTDVEDHPDGWKAYKSSAFLFDQTFAEVVAAFVAESAEGERLTLILNGDVIDFDLITAIPEDPPYPVSRLERRGGLNPTATKAVFKLERALSHHPGFVAALADLLARGGRVVYVLGNHDRELHFPEVQRAFLDAVERRAREAGASLLGGSLSFEPWFFYVPGEIYAEHGHQYDYYSSFRYPLWPVVPSHEGETIALPMGNLSNRYLMNAMGTFNPFASDYILNLFRYLAHWFRHYAFSRRSLALSWIIGSLIVLRKLLGLKRKLRSEPPEDRKRLEATARRFDLAPETLVELGQLHPLPIMHRYYRVMRELWIDRVLIALLLTGGTIALALVPIPLWIKLMVPLSGFPLLYFIYEWLAQGDTIFSLAKVIPERARTVARLLPTPVVAFGHTHVPRQIPLGRGVTYVDTGTWAPITEPRDRTRLRAGYRNVLTVTADRGVVATRFESML
jgi:UDP-2,3-diacylglucosamine pyrophosphatase LpxH